MGVGGNAYLQRITLSFFQMQGGDGWRGQLLHCILYSGSQPRALRKARRAQHIAERRHDRHCNVRTGTRTSVVILLQEVSKPLVAVQLSSPTITPSFNSRQAPLPFIPRFSFSFSTSAIATFLVGILANRQVLKNNVVIKSLPRRHPVRLTSYHRTLMWW